MSSQLWNKIFAANQRIDAADMQSVVNAGTTFDPNQLAAQGQQSLTGQLQGQAYGGGLFWDPNQLQQIGGLTTQQITTILQTFGSITPEEKAELEELKKEYERSVKVAKLGEFKKLPTELRQFIINLISWKEAREKIEATQPDKPERLKELEIKDSNLGSFSQQFFPQWSQHTHAIPPYPNPLGMDILALLPIPAGITAEELKEAHVEASLEEEMLGEQE